MSSQDFRGFDFVESCYYEHILFIDERWRYSFFVRNAVTRKPLTHIYGNLQFDKMGQFRIRTELFDRPRGVPVAMELLIKNQPKSEMKKKGHKSCRTQLYWELPPEFPKGHIQYFTCKPFAYGGYHRPELGVVKANMYGIFAIQFENGANAIAHSNKMPVEPEFEEEFRRHSIITQSLLWSADELFGSQD
jgi:hypothetical protein